MHVAVAAGPAVRVVAEVSGGRGASFGIAVGAGCAEAERFREEARDGARYALMRLPEEARGVLVSVVEIVTAPADTGPGDVKFAAAHAVWRALGREPDRWPWTGEDGDPVFPA
ncbi:hypothetical protein ACFXPX_05840 [Kitasatospora sp. NPDC059146]|uniref:hypothetical protein n=1 Tax=unclassified Kitasatospora TaxID=2633591 RepID=UPI0036CBBFB7